MNDIDILWRLIDRGRKGENIGVSTGLPKLDKLIGGIQPGRYYLISSATSGGKTSLALFLIYNMLRTTEDNYHIYYSLEIGTEVLLSKLMALYCAEEFGVYLTINDILSFEKPLSDYLYNCLQQAREWLNSVKHYLIVLDKGLSARVLYKETINILEKFGKIEEHENKKLYIPNNPKIRFNGYIDHFSLLRTEEGRNLKQEIDLTSSYMVTLKRIFGISWFALQQQNRDSSSMDRRKADLSEPGINDLKDLNLD